MSCDRAQAANIRKKLIAQQELVLRQEEVEAILPAPGVPQTQLRVDSIPHKFQTEAKMDVYLMDAMRRKQLEDSLIDFEVTDTKYFEMSDVVVCVLCQMKFVGKSKYF